MPKERGNESWEVVISGLKWTPWLSQIGTTDELPPWTLLGGAQLQNSSGRTLQAFSRVKIVEIGFVSSISLCWSISTPSSDIAKEARTEFGKRQVIFSPAWWSLRCHQVCRNLCVLWGFLRNVFLRYGQVLPSYKEEFMEVEKVVLNYSI